MSRFNRGKEIKTERRPGQVGEYKVMKELPDPETALLKLQQVHSSVAPIMKKRGWYLPVLAEFYPAAPMYGEPFIRGGQNCGHGQRIDLKLREQGDRFSFHSDERLLAVMIHELTHNVHSEHAAPFQLLMKELWEEYYEFKRQGYTGMGFFSKGAAVGGGQRLAPHDARRLAVKEAEKRAAQQKLLSGAAGGKKLGGAAAPGKPVTKSMKELAAEAAEKRIQLNQSCGGVVAGAGKDHGQMLVTEAEVIVIPDSDDELDIKPPLAGPSKIPFTPQADSSSPSASSSSPAVGGSKIVIDLTGDSSDDTVPPTPIKPNALRKSSSVVAKKKAALPSPSPFSSLKKPARAPCTYSCASCRHVNGLAPGNSFPRRVSCDGCKTLQEVDLDGRARMVGNTLGGRG